MVTQPTEGDFKAFSALCTHQGCVVSEIKGEDIDCTCHGSKFSIADGSVVDGPANEAPGVPEGHGQRRRDQRRLTLTLGALGRLCATDVPFHETPRLRGVGTPVAPLS